MAPAPRSLKPMTMRFSPDEPAKVHVAPLAHRLEPAKVGVAGFEATEDAEKARLLAENAALKERLLQQQCGMQWPWHGDWCSVQPGAQVFLQNLSQTPELNGACAAVERWDAASQRWVVRLASGEEKFVRAANVTAAWGYYGWQAGQMMKSGSCKSLGSESTATGGEEGWTTVMMRNLPNDYSREMLLKLLDAEGFRACYDLLYLPVDYSSHAGFGYAFINLISNAEAERFRRHFTGFARWEVVSQKVCEVSWSTPLQGVRAHVERYRNSPVMHEDVRDEFKPVLFSKGVRVPFPKPTKAIRAPRTRRRDRF